MSTKKLFSENAYQKDGEATVVTVQNDETGVPRIVILDQTVFYAMSGGQPGDTGTIKGPEGEKKVIDTRYLNEGKILVGHYLEEQSRLKPGDKVQLVIDWDRRYRHMRLHSLVHIAGLLFEQHYGHQKCIGSNIADKGRIDYEFFNPIDIEKIQKTAQQLIEEGHEIKTYGDSHDESKRIWEMQGLGTMPCGGTHVKNSREIGKISLKRKSLGKQGQRIYCEILPL
jgi:Ser-tRNA(Ala) deacylase AlaX